MVKTSKIDRNKQPNPAVYLVAAFCDVNLALSALASDNLFSTNPSPLHSEHTPEPPQSSHVLVGAFLPQQSQSKEHQHK